MVILHHAAVNAEQQPPWSARLPWIRLPPDRGKITCTIRPAIHPASQKHRQHMSMCVIFFIIMGLFGQLCTKWAPSFHRHHHGTWHRPTSSDVSPYTSTYTPLFTQLQYQHGYMPRPSPQATSYQFLRRNATPPPTNTQDHHHDNTLCRVHRVHNSTTTPLLPTMSNPTTTDAAASYAAGQSATINNVCNFMCLPHRKDELTSHIILSTSHEMLQIVMEWTRAPSNVHP